MVDTNVDTDVEANPAGETPSDRPRLLMLTHRIPYPPDRGDRIRAFHMLKFLATRYDVSLVSTSEEPAWLQHHQLLAGIADEVLLWPITKTGSRLRGVKALLAGRAVTPACFYRGGLANSILQWHEKRPFDVVLTFCTGMIRYARLLTGMKYGPRVSVDMPRPKHILDLVDVDSVKWASYAKASRSPKRLIYATEAKRLRRIEAGDRDDLDVVCVISEHEAKVYQEQVNPKIDPVVVGNGVDMAYFAATPDADKKMLLFVGVLDYKPNVDGVIWFVKQVFPKLRAKSPDVTFQIVGRNPTRRIEELAQVDGVEVVGSVPDVRAYLYDAAVIVAPLRIARGVQNKVLEAMACQRTVVASPGAAEGIDADAGVHLVVADEPEAWVDELHGLLNDRERRTAIGIAGRARIEERYNWATQLKPLEAQIEALLERKVAPASTPVTSQA